MISIIMQFTCEVEQLVVWMREGNVACRVALLLTTKYPHLPVQAFS